MILKDNLPALFRALEKAEKVLDVGGWFKPLNLTTHVLDIMPYETRRKHEAIDPEHPEKFTKETWISHDACKAPWPFPDKFFDFSFCSHLLEDVRDPLTVCGELVRVSKAGYIETPSRIREIYSKSRFFGLKTALGRMPEVGDCHHRWFVEVEGNNVVFTAKDYRLAMSRGNIITRGDVGRKLSEQESGTALFWKDSFTYEEHFIQNEDDLRIFRQQALRKVSGA